MNNLFEHGKWLGAGGAVRRKSPVKPAPYFRKSFQLENIPEKAEVYFCGLGYSELYLNGKKVDDGVLQPVVTQYDKRAGYLKYDVSALLQPGENVFGAIPMNLATLACEKPRFAITPRSSSTRIIYLASVTF